MTQPRTCAICGTDISGMRRDARVCKADVCRTQARKKLTRRWTTSETKTCSVTEGGARCPDTATRRLTTGEPMCGKHDARATRNGSPTAVQRMVRGHGEVQAMLRRAAASTADECLMMPGPNGGRLSVSYRSRGMTAARAVWIIANGNPGKQHVLHTCHRGDEGCVNPRHLYLGDHAQNMDDRVEAGTSNRGERQWAHKLTEEQVREIRRLCRDERTDRSALAEEYGVKAATINEVVSGRRWSWLED